MVVALVVRFGSAAAFSLVLALPAAGRVTAPFVQSIEAERTAIPFRASTVARAALDRLSPLPAMARLRGRVLIAHGRADISIPYTESVRLAEGARTRAVILSTFHHTGPLSPLELVRAGVPDAWKLLGLADALLSDGSL